MTTYRKLYYFVVGKIDDALTQLEKGEIESAKETLQNTLYEAEDQVCESDMPDDENPQE